MSVNFENKVGWAVIGTPDGLQTSNFGCIKNFDLQGIIDLNNLFIKPFPNNEIICLFRENRKGSIIHYFILYKDAKEIKTDRPGTFYGSVLVLVGHIVDAGLAVKFLKELATGLSPFLTHENRFTSDIRNIRIPAPSCLHEIFQHLKPCENLSVGTREGYMILPVNDELTHNKVINNASESQLVSAFSRIYLSSGKEVLNFIKERGRIEFINTETIQLKLELIALKQQNDLLKISVVNLQKEKETIENSLKVTLGNHEKNIDQLNQTIKNLMEQQKQLFQKAGVENVIHEKNIKIKNLETVISNLQPIESTASAKQKRTIDLSSIKQLLPASEVYQIVNSQTEKARNYAFRMMAEKRPVVFIVTGLVLFVIVLLAFLI